MECCNDRISSLAVSSVLSADTKQYGKKFLIDDDDDTCWSSDQVRGVIVCTPPFLPAFLYLE